MADMVVCRNCWRLVDVTTPECPRCHVAVGSGPSDGGESERPVEHGKVPSFVDSTASTLTVVPPPDVKLGCLMVGALAVLAFFVSVFGLLGLWLLLIDQACSDPEGCEDLVAVVPPFGLMLVVWPLLAGVFVYIARLRRSRAAVRSDAWETGRADAVTPPQDTT